MKNRRNITLYSRVVTYCLLLFLFGVLTPQASANHIAEKLVSKQDNGVPLSTILDKLATAYDVNLVYDSDLVKGKTVEKKTVDNSGFEMELEKVLATTNLGFKKINNNTYVLVKLTSKSTSEISIPTIKEPIITAQIAVLSIKGKVVDGKDGEPLIGVNVISQKTRLGTTTDFDGTFAIDVEKGDVLLFSYIGYQTREIPILNGNDISLELFPDEAQLDEVIVVGYGTQKKSDLTGSLSSVRAEDIKELPSTGLDQALQGRAAGVQVTQNSGAPGGGVSIRIRGIGSTLSAEPLYVIDGIPISSDNSNFSTNFADFDGGGQNSNALNTINPNDIESIEILKDASATAIYGSRAANGVVLITTKRGGKGKSGIAYETYFGVQEIAKDIEVLDLKGYAEYYADVGGQGIEEFNFPELLGKGTNWQEEIFRDANMQNHQLTLTGGSDKTNFAFSSGFHQKDGIVIGSDFERFSSKLNIDHKFNDRVRFGNTLLLSKTKENITLNDNSNGVVYTGLLMVPNAPVRNADGSFAGPAEEITLQFDNPVARALETRDVNKKTRVLANFYGEVDLFKGLTYRAEVGTDLVFSNHKTFLPSFKRGNFFGKSGLRKTVSSSYFWINKHLLTYKNQFSANHGITMLGGFEVQSGGYEWDFASRDNLPTNDLFEIALGSDGNQINNGGADHWALLSYFGRLNYNFADRILVTGTLRTDGSSRFGRDNRYAYFPSGAIAWRVSNESFLQDVDVIDNLKVRVGYGSVGNQEIPNHSFINRLRNTPIAVGDALITGYGPFNIANPNVRWESSIQSNMGIDFGLYNNRIELIADYYIKRADGMLLPALLPLTAGSLETPIVNIGEIVNQGLELTLNTYNWDTKNFDWNSSVNFSINNNEVVSLGSNGNLTGIIQQIPVTRTEEGQQIGQFYGHVMLGIFQSQDEVNEAPFQANGTRAGDIQFADLDNNGIIDDNDRQFLGSPHPDYTLNISNKFEFYGFDLSIFIQGVYGNEILNLVKRDIEGMIGFRNQGIAVLDRYTIENPSTTVPRSTGPDPNDNRRISDRYVEDGSFTRIKNITFGYNFPTLKKKYGWIKNFRMYASVQNLYTWTDFSGYDPEIGSFNQSPLINGVENGRYPTSRSYTFGLQANF